MMFFKGVFFYIYVQYQANFELDNITFGVDPQYRLSDICHFIINLKHRAKQSFTLES